MNSTQTRLIGAVAAAVLIAGSGGYMLARRNTPAPSPTIAPAGADAMSAGFPDKITLAPAAIKAAGVAVEAVEAGGLSAEIIASATVTAPPQGQAVLTARAAGAVTRIFKRLGDRVRAGEPLAIVTSRDAAQIAADRTSAAAKATLANKNMARERSLYQQRVSPRVDLEQAVAEAAVAAAEARRAQLAGSAAGVTADGRGVIVASPINGQITTAPASLGAFVQPETELFRVADPTRIQVEAAVDSAAAPRIRVGDRAELKRADGSIVAARVRSITAALGVETRAATAVLEPVGGSLRLGETLTARIYPANGTASAAIAVPEEAVQSLNGRDVVFVRTASGFIARPVTSGQRSAGRVEIVAGLVPGTRIATSGAFVLKAELAKGTGEEQ